MQDLTKEQWKEQLAANPDAVIIDVRTPEEVEEGIIPKALHHDIYDPQAFMDAIQAMDATKHYYVYCRSGGRSGQACQLMNQVGIPHTYNLIGGFSNWDGEVAVL